MTFLPAVLGLLLCLMVLQAEGQRHGSSSCKCLDEGVNNVSLRQRKNIEMFPVSNSCPRVELIANLKNGDRICLNPNSTFSKMYIARKLKRTELKHQTHHLSPHPRSNTTSVSNTTSIPPLR